MRDFFERYGDRIRIGGTDECWPWIRGTTTAGYGHFYRDGEHIYAHRAAYESQHGDGSAAGLLVRHDCDNPPCCNPGHLIGGSSQDNVDDMWARGRARPLQGQDHPRAILTDDDVMRARGLAANGALVGEIARQFAIGHAAMELVVKGIRWSHLPGAVPNPRVGRPVKLDAAAASEIRRRLQLGEVGASLAREYGVTQATICDVKYERSWPNA